MPVAVIPRVSPDIGAVITRGLTQVSSTFTVDAKGRLVETPESSPLWIERAGNMIVPRGLLPRVLHTLAEAGHGGVCQSVFAPPPSLAIDTDALQSMQRKDQDLAAAIVEHARGTIAFGSKHDIGRIYSVIARAFPDCSVVVALPTVAAAVKHYQRIVREVGSKVGSVGLAVRGILRNGERWIVGTPGTLPRSCATSTAIVLFPQPLGMTSRRVREWAIEYRTGRAFTLVTPKQLDSQQQLAVEALGGPVIYSNMPARTPVCVTFTSTSGVPSEDMARQRNESRHLNIKRQLYWECEPRNKLIAQIAQVSADAAETAERTCILVEGLPHARTLAAELPSWPIVSGVDVVETSTAIITATAAATHSMSASTIIIATGTPWPPRIRDIQRGSSPMEQESCQIIDLDDRHHPLAVADAQSRRREYIRRGYTVTVT